MPETLIHRPDETLIQFGSKVKRHAQGKYGGHLVLFGSPDEKDLYGDFFTPGTDFDLYPDQKSAVYYQHTMDYHFKNTVLGRGTLGVDDLGIWIESQVQIRDDYLAALDDMINEGMMGWSSGTASHLVKYGGMVGDAFWIERWPLGLDASITPCPADPRQAIQTLKSLTEEWTNNFGGKVEIENDTPKFFTFKYLRSKLPVVKAISEDTLLSGETAELKNVPSDSTINLTIKLEDNTMAESQQPIVTLESLKAQQDNFSKSLDEIMDYIKNQPSLRKAGYVTDDGGTADQNVRSMGDFFLAVARKDTTRLRKVYKSHQQADNPAIKTDLVEDSGNLGGWAIPTDFDARLLQATLKASAFLGKVPRIPVSLPAGKWPYLDIFIVPTAGAGGDAFSAGLSSATRAEGGTFVETNPQLEQLEWRVNDIISGSIQVSKELRRDASAIEGLLMRLIAINDQSKQEYFVLRGNGAGQPLGILNSNALVNVSPGTDNIFSWADALSMFSQFYVIDESTCQWLIHPSVIPDVGTFQVGTGTGTTFVSNLSAGLPMPLLGMPLGKNQHLAQANASGDALLIDWSAYQIWDLGGSYVDFSEHVGFLNGLDTWRFGRYMDGKPVWRDKITLSSPGSAYTMSPFVSHDD